MKWDAGCVIVSHSRALWDKVLCEPVQIHCRLDQITGKWEQYGRAKEQHSQQYAAAKFKFHKDSALKIVDRCWNAASFVETVSATLDYDFPPIVVFPHLPFDDHDAVGFQFPIKKLPTNALPFAFARVIANRLGGTLDNRIVQSARVGRTALGRWLRLLCQPSFSGEISTSHPYVLVDDVFTTGGTLAALRSHIVEHGGSVIATAALAQKDGVSYRLAIADATRTMLNSLYGESFEPYWRRTTGHDANCLTEAEGQFLVRWARDEQVQKGILPGNDLFLHLRDRINKAAARGG